MDKLQLSNSGAQAGRRTAEGLISCFMFFYVLKRVQLQPQHSASNHEHKTGGAGVCCKGDLQQEGEQDWRDGDALLLRVCSTVTAGFQTFCYHRSGPGVFAVTCKSLTLILRNCGGSFVMKKTSCLKN